MSQLEMDAAKRAAAGESLGAFATLDINRLDKDELIQLGMREALSKYLGIVNRGIESSVKRRNLMLEISLRELGSFIKADLDAATEILLRSSMRRSVATLQEIPREVT